MSSTNTAACASRRRRLLRVSAALSLALALLLLHAVSSAQARPPYQLGLYDQIEFTDPSLPAEQRGYWLDRANDAGAGVIRVDLIWQDVLVDDSVAPADPTNPADANYDFSVYDSAVRAATQRGLAVLFTIWKAPRYAEGPDRPPADCAEGAIPPACAPEGSWKPDPQAFADFGAAIATRYSGSFTPIGDSSPLPKVSHFQAWNEPNLFTFMNPQQAPDGSPWVADHYRSMLDAFYDSVHAAQPGATVLAPGTAPAGPGTDAVLSQVRTGPLDFMRQLFCVRVSKGKIVKACSLKPSFDVLAHNAIPSSNRDIAELPYYPNSDLRPSNFEKGTSLLRAAERLGQVTPAVSGGRPIWATEFWTASNPPDPTGPSQRSQADTIQRAMRMIWEKGADAFLYFKLRDQVRLDAGNPGGCERQCGVGLYPNTATWPFTQLDQPPKPALTAFAFPFTVERSSKAIASAWFRPSTTGSVVIEQQAGGTWRQLAKGRARAGVPETVKLALTGKARLRARQSGRTSLVWALPSK